MSDIVIQAENLGKSYLVGHQLASTERYTALRDVLMRNARGLARKTRDILAGRTVAQGDEIEEFWALKDVNFEIAQGDRVGIIGRNGAGKSTLLKILSRITEPSTGRVSINGRVASLLEVGTGFHPELTGRENIYLNGAILGMSRAEVRRKFDEIVAFAEVEKFLDTPVKRYSSGMYVRLAFAVAAFLSSDILIVDEVLAVGDAQFQKKCLEKMGDARKDGRTVFFVSHNMNAIENLCNSVILLDGGRLVVHSPDVRATILAHCSPVHAEGGHESKWEKQGSRYTNPWFSPIEFRICNEDFAPLSEPATHGATIWVEITAEVEIPDPALTIGYALYAEGGNLLYWSYHTDSSSDITPLQTGTRKLLAKIPADLLNEGEYRLELIGGLHNRQWLFEPGIDVPAIHLEIRGGLSDSPYWISKRPGLLAPNIQWTVA